MHYICSLAITSCRIQVETLRFNMHQFVIALERFDWLKLGLQKVIHPIHFTYVMVNDKEKGLEQFKCKLMSQRIC